MRAKESTRTGRVQSTTNDWTFLDPFFAAGAIFMFDFFLSVSDEILRVKMCCFEDGEEREKSRVFFFVFHFFNRFFCSGGRHFFFFDKKKKTKKKKKTTKKMIFNLEGLTVYFPYEYLYPVRFKRVDFLTLLFCYHFLRRASLSFLARTIQTTT